MKRTLAPLILSILSVSPWVIHWGTWQLFRPSSHGGPQIFWKVDHLLNQGWSGHCIYIAAGVASLGAVLLAICYMAKKRRPYWLGGIALAVGALGAFCFWSQIVDFVHSL